MITEGMGKVEIHGFRCVIGFFVFWGITSALNLSAILPEPLVGLLYIAIGLCGSYGAGYFTVKGIEALQRWRSKPPKISN